MQLSHEKRGAGCPPFFIIVYTVPLVTAVLLVVSGRDVMTSTLPVVLVAIVVALVVPPSRLGVVPIGGL